MKTSFRLISTIMLISFLSSCSTNSYNDDLGTTSTQFSIPSAPFGQRIQNFKVGDRISNIAVIGSNIKWYEKEYLIDPIVDNRFKDRELFRLVPLKATDYLINGKKYCATQTVAQVESKEFIEITVYLTFSSSSN